MWDRVINKLQRGETVEVNASGNSMTPRIYKGDKVTIIPLSSSDHVDKGDIVLAKVRGRIYCHLVTAVSDNKYQISNNHGHVNGWTSREKIYGKVQA